MALIFVSYRRQDTQSATGRLCDKLQAHFGDERVFHDIESIDAGVDFAETIAAKVGSSSVVLAMIGPRWLAAGSAGTPRIHDPGDYVRLEISTALQRRIPIIPVLVEGATIAGTPLPDEIASLFNHQAHEITEQRWQYDTDRLVEQLEKFVPRDDSAPGIGRSAARDAFDALVGYVADFVQLLVHPRRHLGVLLARPNHVTRAAVFFAVSQLIAAWQFVLPDLVESVPAFVLAGVPIGALVVLLLAVPLHLAGRVAGASSRAPTTLAMCAYIESVAMIVAATGVLMIWTGLELGDRNIGPAISEILSSTLPSDIRVARLTEVVQAAYGPAFMATFALANVLWLYAVGWLVVASTAFPAVWQISRLRAAAVLALFAMMLVLIAGFVAFAATLGAGRA